MPTRVVACSATAASPSVRSGRAAISATLARIASRCLPLRATVVPLARRADVQRAIAHAVTDHGDDIAMACGDVLAIEKEVTKDFKSLGSIFPKWR